MKDRKLLPLKGTIQDYAWGGQDFLASFTGREKPDDAPWAELWLGAHPKGPAETPAGSLEELIANAPGYWLGEAGAKEWNGQLPFLLKVLDVQKMLSIQVHPTKTAAEIGFAEEERSGPTRNAPNRNYRDANHKPELGVAVTDFYLLHGFKTDEELRRVFQVVPGWADLQQVYYLHGIQGLYRYVMKAEQSTVNEWLAPLAEKLEGGDYQSSSADHWAQRAFKRYTKNGNYDRGIFSIYWLNLVHLRPGEGIFQDAGILHAYLQGVCIELMANSDNVLRGGLTPKHIDVPELVKQLDYKHIHPRIIKPVAQNNKWQYYPTPAPDFKLYTLNLNAGESVEVADSQVAIYLVFEGSLSVGGKDFTSGKSFIVPAGFQQTITAGVGGVTIYRATVG
ncbi:mannose-6-phosphate isomerase, class I [Lewinellaceae bacterium SD302]|nr:mannose-6-phosphate isomerase, class I [Lewinellaceae bacterium SD302]